MAKQKGRPKLSISVRRSEVFCVRVTKAELTAIKLAAKRENLSPHNWAKKSLLSATQ